MPAGEGPVESFEFAMLAARRAAEMGVGAAGGGATDGSAGVAGVLLFGKPVLRSALRCWRSAARRSCRGVI